MGDVTRHRVSLDLLTGVLGYILLDPVIRLALHGTDDYFVLLYVYISGAVLRYRAPIWLLIYHSPWILFWESLACWHNR